MPGAERASDGYDETRDELKKVELVEDAQLSFFIVVHPGGQSECFNAFERLRGDVAGGLKFPLPVGDGAEGLHSSVEERWPLR